MALCLSSSIHSHCTVLCCSHPVFGWATCHIVAQKKLQKAVAVFIGHTRSSAGTLRKMGVTPSTAGNFMASSERPSPEPLLKKEVTPAVLGGENSGNALEVPNALNYGVWGIPAVLSTVEGNSRKRSESVSGVFPEFFPKVPAVLGLWPRRSSIKTLGLGL